MVPRNQGRVYFFPHNNARLNVWPARTGGTKGPLSTSYARVVCPMAPPSLIKKMKMDDFMFGL